MKITGFHIDGFGIFRDFAVEGLGEGVTVFFGQNEAGKSTLLDFIRYTLFGYPRRSRRGRDLREPLRGGRHGGRLRVAVDGATVVTVECFGGGIPSLSGGDSHRWRQYLRGLSLETFQSYFAFDLDELRDVTVMPPADVEAVLLDAARIGRFRSPASVLKELRDKKEQLYTSLRAKSKPIAAELALLADLARRIAACRERPREYEEARRKLDDIDEELLAARKCQERASEALGAIKLQIEARPYFLEWSAAHEFLRKLEKVTDFPADGVRQLEELDRKIGEIERQVESRKAEVLKLEARMSARTPDGRWLEAAETIEALVRERSAAEERSRRLGELEKERQSLWREVETGLGQLGREWTVDRVERVAVDLVAEDRLRVPLEKAARIEADLENEQKEAESEEARLRAVESRIEQKRGVLERQEELDPQELSERLEAVTRWLEADSERRHAMERAEDVGRALDRARGDLDAEEARLEAIEARRPSAAAWVAPAAMGLAALAIAAAFLATGRLLYGAMATIAVMVLAALSLVARSASVRERGRLDDERLEAERRRRRFRAEIERLQSELERLQEKAGDVEREREEAARVAGVEVSADRSTVERLRRRIEGERSRAVEQARLRGEIEQLQTQAEETRQRLRGRLANVENLESQIEEVRGDLRSALSAVGLPETLSPERALGAFAEIRRLREKLNRIGQLDGEIASERGAIEGFARRVVEVARRLEAQVAGDWRAGVEALERCLDEQRRLAEEVREIKKRIGEIEVEIGAFERQLGQLRDERKRLLEEGGAPDNPVLFRRRAQRAEAYARALDRVKKARAALEARRPEGVSVEQFVRELEGTDWALVESDKTKLESELGERRRQYENLLRERGRLETEIRRLEREEELFDLRQRQEAARAHLAELVRRWNVLAVAEALMQRVQEIYDRERQPKQIRRASELFRRFTRGRFEAVRLDDENGPRIRAVRSNLEELLPEQLSRGTREQLYLALRLALVDQLAEQGIVLPLVFDDVLVNFDDRRVRATAQTLAEFARGRQLWYFTAHERMRDLFVELAGARVINLDAAAS